MNVVCNGACVEDAEAVWIVAKSC